MAETLAQAVLEVGVDDSRLRAGLKGVEQQAGAAGEAISRRFTSSGREILKAANGLEYFMDASGRARAENGRLITTAERLAAGIGRTGDGLKVLKLDFDSLGRLALSAAGALGVFTSATEAVNFAVTQNIAYQDAAAAVETLGVNSEELGGKLRELSGELNNNISTVDLLKASYDVASSGFSKTADAVDILKASALGAIGGFSDINTVADATTSVLNAYGLSATNATKIVDGFIQTQNDGKIVVAQYAQEIGRVAPTAAAAGVSIQELNAAVSAATAQGVPVGSTFAGLRQAITAILKPTSQATELASQLGVSFNAQALKAQGLGQFLANLEEKTGGAADAIVTLLGSVEAQAAIQPLLNDSLETYGKFLEAQVGQSGQAAKAAEIASNTISGSLKRLQNALSDVATQSNKALQPLAKVINLGADATKLFAPLGEAAGKNLGSFNPLIGAFDDLTKLKALINSDPRLKAVLEFYTGTFNQSISGAGKEFNLIEPTIDAFFGGQTGVGQKEALAIEREIAAVRKEKREKDEKRDKDALFARQAAQRDIIRPAERELEIARKLFGLDGERLRQAKQALDIEKLRAEERKKEREFKSLGGNAAVREGSTAAITAKAELEAAGINVRTEIVKGADELRKRGIEIREEIEKGAASLVEAGKSLQRAQESAANAVVGNLEIASDAALKNARQTLEADIRKNLQSGSIDPLRFAQKFGAGFENERVRLGADGVIRQQQLGTPTVDLSSLSLEALKEASQQTSALADAQANVVEAQKDLAKATKDLTSKIAASNERETNLAITVPVGGQRQVYLP